ncbi:MAG: type VI secretion system baseplate subunit TssG [Planctomycetales bacterium]|nr:type VI secretion system baseplate subunit TssG [Planctomycetales bacterium]
MASTRRSSENTVTGLLKDEPYLFSFIQAVRLLELGLNDTWLTRRLGHDNLPTVELLRFAGYVARSFPPAEVIDMRETKTAPDQPKSFQLTVGFMGLFGPSGVLPHHDTQRLIDAGTKNNPERDFLDIFNHRILSLYYRASTKYRLSFSYEAAYRQSSPDQQPTSRAFFATAGMATEGLRHRLEFPDELAVEFCGAFSTRSKNSTSLQQMLEFYFQLPCRVQQFVGNWVYLSAENKSEMPGMNLPEGRNCSLGQSFILGERIWDISGKFRIRIGPLNYAQFAGFLPGSRPLIELAQLIQFYVGMQYEFDIQLVLQAAQVPQSRLGQYSRLGFDSWLISRQPSQDADQAIIRQSGLPTRQCSTAA